MISNPLINDFIAAVEAVNDGELTVLEMHDAYATGDVYGDNAECINDFNLALLSNFAAKVQEAVNLAIFRRAQLVSSPASDALSARSCLPPALPNPRAERPDGGRFEITLENALDFSPAHGMIVL